MRLWPFHRARVEPHADADAAAAQARRANVDADRLACRVDEVADRTQAIHERNHFGAAADWAMQMRRA